MSARALLLCALLLAGPAVSCAAPRPNIPSSELPGRERERFIDPFPQPRSSSEPLFVTPKRTAPAKRHCKKRRKC